VGRLKGILWFTLCALPSAKIVKTAVSLESYVLLLREVSGTVCVEQNLAST
jgi:hypothetical protein